jgi:type II secretory pathway component PulM
VVVVAVLIYLALWEPAAVGIRRLTADLPQLREQNAAIHAMADEAARLRAAAGATAPIATPQRAAAVRRSLERVGLWSASATPGAARADAAPLPQARSVQTLSVGGAVTTVSSAVAPTRTAPPEVTADGERVRVRFDDVDYGVWAGWLAAAEGELAARATRVTITSTAPKSPVGHVRAEATFDWTPPTAAPARS